MIAGGPGGVWSRIARRARAVHRPLLVTIVSLIILREAVVNMTKRRYDREFTIVPINYDVSLEQMLSELPPDMEVNRTSSDAATLTNSGRINQRMAIISSSLPVGTVEARLFFSMLGFRAATHRELIGWHLATTGQTRSATCKSIVAINPSGQPVWLQNSPKRIMRVQSRSQRWPANQCFLVIWTGSLTN